MRNPQFHDEANDFIHSLIKQRKYLISSGKSLAAPGYINNCLMELDRYMEAYKYDDNEKMARFWVNHSDLIFALIPGRKSGAHESCVKTYHLLSKAADIIHNHPVPWWEPIMQVSAN